MKIQHLKNFLVLISPAIFWGILFMEASQVFNYIAPLYFAIIRYVPSLIILLVVLYYIEGKSAYKFNKDFFLVLLAGTFSMSGFNVIAWEGVKLSNGIIAAIFQPITPLIAIVISFIFFKQKYNSLTFITILIAFFGVFLSASEGNLNFLTQGHPLGFLLIFIGASMSVVAAVLAPRFKDFSVLRYATVTQLGGAIGYVVFAFIGTELGYIAFPTVKNILNIKWELLYATLFSGVLPMLLWFKSIKLVGPVNGMLMNNLIPVVAIIGSIIVGFPITIWEILGTLIIIVAMILHYYNIKRETNNVL